MRKLILLSLILLGGCRAKSSDNAPPLEQVTLSLHSIHFAPTYPGFDRDILLTVQNTGQLYTTVTLANLPTSPFVVSSVPGSGSILAPQEIMQVTVQFAPPAVTETSYSDTMEIITTASLSPSFLLPLSGTATKGSSSVHPAGNLSALSIPSNHDNDDVVFVSEDKLWRYEAGTDLTLSMSSTQIQNIIHPALGKRGSRKVLLATSGGDATENTKDDTLLLVEVQASSFFVQSVIVGVEISGGGSEGGMSSNSFGRPVRLGEYSAAVAISGEDGAWGTADDTVTFVNFNTGLVLPQVVGYLDPTLQSCRINGDGVSIVTLASPGSISSWGGADDTVHWIKYDSGSNTADPRSMTGIPGGLDPTLSEVLPRNFSRALYMRPGPSVPGMGNSDDQLVEIAGGAQSENYVLTIPNIQGMFVSLSSNEIAVPVQGSGGIALQYVMRPVTGLQTSGSPIDFPNLDLSTLVSGFRPTGLIEEDTSLEIGAQLFGLDLTNGVLEYFEIITPGTGPSSLETFTVGSITASATPAIFSNGEWAALSLSPSNEVAICGFRKTVPQVGTYALTSNELLNSSLVSRAVVVGDSTVVVLTGGVDGLGNNNDMLVRIDFPIP